MNCARGEELASFRDAIAAELSPANSSRPYLLKRYISGGLYADQVARYLDVFPREQVLIEIVDRPNEEAADVIARAIRFAGLQPSQALGLHENAQVEPVYPLLNALIYYSGVKMMAARITPRPIKTMAKRVLYRRDTRKISDADRAALRPYFEQDIARLEQLIGEPLDHWKA